MLTTLRAIGADLARGRGRRIPTLVTEHTLETGTRCCAYHWCIAGTPAAHHSGAHFVARFHDLDKQLARYRFSQDAVSDALTVADQTTGLWRPHRTPRIRRSSTLSHASAIRVRPAGEADPGHNQGVSLARRAVDVFLPALPARRPPGVHTGGDGSLHRGVVPAWRATGMINYYRASLRTPPKRAEAALVPIKAPTLVIWGQDDGYLGSD